MDHIMFEGFFLGSTILNVHSEGLNWEPAWKYQRDDSFQQITKFLKDTAYCPRL